MHNCSKCHIDKEYSEFGKSKLGYWKNDKGEGINSQCKTCIRTRIKNDPTYKDRANKYRKEKMKNDICFKLSINLRNRLNTALKNNYKTGSAIKLLGCSIAELKLYLESKFLDGMNWENHSLHGWHIDHIRPCVSFDLADSEQQKICFHYTNLQPMWAGENLSKHAKCPE